MSRFTPEQWDAMQDGIYEERNQRAADRGCSYCNGSGHNCPECSGWDDESEEEEDEQ